MNSCHGTVITDEQRCGRPTAIQIAACKYVWLARRAAPAAECCMEDSAENIRVVQQLHDQQASIFDCNKGPLQTCNLAWEWLTVW